MNVREEARKVIRGATCILLDAELYAHGGDSPFRSIEDALTCALHRAILDERESCAELVEAMVPRGIQARRAITAAAEAIRARQRPAGAGDLAGGRRQFPFLFLSDED